MDKADRDASVFELVLRTIIDLRKGSPDFEAIPTGLASLNAILERAAMASVTEDNYECFIMVLMLSGLCHKFLYELMPGDLIDKSLIESSIFGEFLNAHRKSTLQRNPSDIQSAGNSDN